MDNFDSAFRPMRRFSAAISKVVVSASRSPAEFLICPAWLPRCWTRRAWRSGVPSSFRQASTLAHVSQAVGAERAARAIREAGRPDLAEKILVAAERALHRRLAVVFDDLPMVRHDGRRTARASAFDLLTDAALSAVDFAEGTAPGVTAMMALTG